MCGIWKQRVQGAYTMKLLPSVIVCGFASAALACSDLSSAQHAAIPQYIQAAIVNPARQEKDRQRDANQKPGEVLTFAGVKPGFRVADFWPAPPYSTGLLSGVVGPKGHVYAVVPEKVVREVPEAERDTRNWLAPYSSNTSLLIQPLE